MTHMAISTAFRKLSAENGYQSDAFDRFLQNRQIIANRLESKYQNTRYPAADFISEADLVGQPYNRINGGVNASSADVIAATPAVSSSTQSAIRFSALKKCIPEQSNVTTLPGVSPIIILLSFQARCLRFVRN